jgi:hypothetical protein
LEQGDTKELVPEKDDQSSIDNLKTPSPGEDLLERIRRKEILEEPVEDRDQYSSKIIDGVEVVDVKAIQKKEKPGLDKFGIPEPKGRRTWDRI